MSGRTSGAFACLGNFLNFHRNLQAALPPALAAAALALITPHAAAASGEPYVEGEVTLATDYMVRGASQTQSRAALQACVEFGLPNGLYGYVFGSNVDYIADGDPDDGARLELDLALGYEHALTERLTASLTRVEYFNPGTNPGIDYDFGEWVGAITLDNRHSLLAGHAENYIGTGEPAFYLGLGTGTGLPLDLALEVKVGHYDLQAAFGESYVHGTLALSGSKGAFAWELSYHVTDGSARHIAYESVVEPRLVLTANVTVW